MGFGLRHIKSPQPQCVMLCAIPGAGGGELQNRPIIDSLKLCKTLRELRDNQAVKAVVVRVDSPGASLTVLCNSIVVCFQASLFKSRYSR